ncbi:NAD-dependent epimerase/dehydratase family protein [Micromonospora sp. DR5-3]|uniref:NAD-dependent epimerase/dehydratase family protein n=1 Tax=unclassified Micromonospora TaxID=2617518 RepID=UPI0011D6C889|nr:MULTISPECIES: NAD-dependent epimerase/dehydratase family protein [unclassified Micromonospora]MCW3814984.1 NAD-dependent epimerase/dehydratase family protein [Micromonospora sp. DR5-3]TYC25310.1 NAD-dependent epimerase/dehydratase family protein [Micromonospora sp. MP36]
MRLLITGGAGFIGANLVRIAAADPTVTDIRVLDDLSTGSRANLAGLDVELREASILDETRLSRAMTGRDVVVHLAAMSSVPGSIQEPVAAHSANATGTLCVLEAARREGVRHVVLASSSSVYGANPELPKSELTWTSALSPYAAGKLATEAYASAYQACYGLPTLAFRFFNVYGPGQRHDHTYAAVIPRFVHAALRNEPVVVYGDGQQTRDFTYVDTVCEVILDAVRRHVHHPLPVNLAYGTRTDLHAVLAELELILGRPVARRYAPARVGDILHSEADNKLLRQLFPQVEAVPLGDGLAATVAWHEAQLPLRAQLVPPSERQVQPVVG